jgi:tetratricopeptide (TPR) repeat protein
LLNSVTRLVNIVKNNNSDEVFQQIVDLFKEYLSMHPYDTEIWLKFALLFLQLPKDEDNALDCLKKILVYNPDNVIAKILYGCFADYFGDVDKQVFELVCSIKTNDQELLSIQEFEKSLYYYSYKDQTQCKEALLKSIDYCIHLFGIINI